MQRKYIYLALKFFIFLIILFGIDRSVGVIFNHLTEVGLQKAPNLSRTEYTMRKVETDVVIIGSSRAKYHYIPSIMSDSLNRTVFNCGFDKQGLTYGVAMVHAILNRYSPEIIIIDTESILLQLGLPFRKLTELYPYYNDDEYYKKLIDQEDAKNRYRMLSVMYRWNSRFGFLFERIFLTDDVQDNGYTGLSNHGYKYPTLVYHEYEENDLVDLNSVELFVNIIKRCNEKNIKLILSISPRFQESNINEVNSFIYLKRLLEDNNIPLIDMGDNTIINDSTMYKDNGHMNQKGSVAFTKAFLERLKEEI